MYTRSTVMANCASVCCVTSVDNGVGMGEPAATLKIVEVRVPKAGLYISRSLSSSAPEVSAATVEAGKVGGATVETLLN